MRLRLKLPLLILMISGLGALLQGGTAAALSGSSFTAANIIDDSTFFTSNPLNTGDIQNFLNAKVPTCDTNGTQMYNSTETRAQYGASVGNPAPYTCLKNYSQAFPDQAADAYCGGISGGTKSAADVIFDVSQACGVSAQTLLVLLQKEQSLVTDDWPWPIEYRSATGYGCPDTAACDTSYYGFFNQVYNAAHQFKRYVAQPQNFNYVAGSTSYVAYNPSSACGGTNLTLQDQATAALYNYTPYQPDQAALNNLYGSGDSCSAYGNRNFWRLFNDWFGPTSGNGFTRVVSSDSGDPRQWLVFGNIKQYIPDSQTIYAWGLQNTPLLTMDAGYLSKIPTGPTLQRMFRLNVAGSNTTVYFVDGGVRHVIPWPSLVDSWNLGGMAISGIPRDLFNLEQAGSDLTYAVKNSGSSTIYMLDGSNGSGQTVIRQYQDATVFNAWEGDNAAYTTLDSNSGFFNLINQAIGSTITSAKISYGGQQYEVANGSRTLNPDAATSALFPGAAQAVSATTFNRLPDAGKTTYLVRSVNDPAVYLVDGTKKYHITSSTSLSAWGNATVPITLVNNAFTSELTTASDLASYAVDDGDGQLYIMDGSKVTVPSSLNTAYRNALSVFTTSPSLESLLPASSRVATSQVIPTGDAPVYFLDNSGKLHHEYAGQLTAWGGYQQGITSLSPAIINGIQKSSDLSTYVTDGTTEYYIDGGKKWILPGSVKTAWGITATPQSYTDGTLAQLPTAGTLTTAIRDSAGGYYYIRGGVAHVTFDVNIGQAWGLSQGTVMSPSFATNNFPVYMLTRFVKSSVTGDNRSFIVNNGTWYNLSAAQAANLGMANQPAMLLDPSLAPNTISDWTNFMVQDSRGVYYIIDGGTKRQAPNATIINQWDSNGTVTVPVMTDGFLNLLPTGPNIERAIKTQNSPSVYVVNNGRKNHILYSSTYQQLYAPFTNITDQLANVLPNGPDI